MDNKLISKIVSILCDVADRTEMTEEEKKYYDMAIGIISMMSQGEQ